MYGFNTKEVFFHDLLGKSVAEKEEYVSYMDRLNYTRHLIPPNSLPSSPSMKSL